MRTEAPARPDRLRRLAWFVALWAGGVLAFGAVTLVFRALPPALLALWAPGVSASEVAASLQTYLERLTAVEQATGPTSLEPVFDAAGALQDALMQIEGEQARIERLDEAEFSALRTRARGMALRRGADVYAQPDPAFLLDLARRHGRPADQAFFAAYEAYWDEEGVPAYLLLGGRPRPCVRFGENLVVLAYARWRDFAARHPSDYVAFTRQAIADAEETLELGTCACGDVDDVMREQRAFLGRFPDARAPDRIRARLDQLATSPEAMPVHCR